MDLHGKRTSSIILHRVPPAQVEGFLEWERGITEAAKAFPGYQATDVYPPADPKKPEWVVVLHFDDVESMRRWAESPQRIDWTSRLDPRIRSYQMKTLPDGFASWFAGVAEGGPQSWQMALTVVLALYPTVMLLNIVLGHYLAPLGMAASMLIGNILSVSILQWLVMPRLQPALSTWLHPELRNRTARLVAGAVIIAAVLLVMVALFRRVTG
ncbi:MAG: hypothetical protein ABS79_03690 [Planctomycetes bacterium SCN 63-9]|nr:MAG: hypothetical protein ABS79_03690 [Planctomycetes bacterium SCN 63-9]